MREYRTMDYIQNVLVDPSYLHPVVARTTEAWRARAAVRMQAVRDGRTTNSNRIQALEHTIIERIIELGAFHERTRRRMHAGGAVNTALFSREAEACTRQVVEAVEALSNILERHCQELYTVRVRREELKTESHNAQVLTQTLAAQFEGARGIARVMGRDVEALTIVVQHAQRHADALAAQIAEIRVANSEAQTALELEYGTTHNLSEECMQLQHKLEQTRAQLAEAQDQLRHGQEVAAQVQAAQAQVRAVHAPLQPKASVHVGYCRAVLENVHVKAGAEYLIGTENGPSPLRWMLNVDLGLNNRIRGNGLFAGVSGSTRGVTGSYEMSQLNGKLFHGIKVEGQLPPRLMVYPSLGDVAGIGLLIPMRRDLSFTNALRQGQIALTNRVFDDRKSGLQVQQTLTVKHAPQPTVLEQLPARVRAVDKGYAVEDRKPDVVMVETDQLVQPPTMKVRPTSPNAGTGSTGLSLVLGLAASLLVLGTLFKKFKRNKRTP